MSCISNIVVAGCGNFGSWWAAGLLAHAPNAVINIYDPHINNTNLIVDRAFSLCVGHAGLTSEVKYNLDISGLPSNPDIVIVATDSANRLACVRQLLEHCQPRAWILEKVIATSPRALDTLQDLLSGRKTFVNHPRRLQPIWSHARLELISSYSIARIEQTLDAWELASNSFHFADLVSFLFDTSITFVSTKNLKPTWRASRVRQGFLEVDGSLLISYSNGIKHTISKMNADGESLLSFFDHAGVLRLVVDDKNSAIYDSCGTSLGRSKTYNWSEIVYACVLDIVNDRSSLPSLREAAVTHYALLTALEVHWRKSSSFNGFDGVPIS